MSWLIDHARLTVFWLVIVPLVIILMVVQDLFAEDHNAV
jgi:hypothetical protein